MEESIDKKVVMMEESIDKDKEGYQISVDEKQHPIQQEKATLFTNPGGDLDLDKINEMGKAIQQKLSIVE